LYEEAFFVDGHLGGCGYGA